MRVLIFGMLYCIERVQDRENWIRESWVKAMEARIVRTNLEKCYRVEGVNHYENCKHLADRYTEMLRENKVSPSFCVMDPSLIVYNTP